MKLQGLFFVTILFWSELGVASEQQKYFSPPFQMPELNTSQMDFGGAGLIQMPSGRMADEGEFSFGYLNSSEYDFYTLSLQLTPWLESTIRYTQVADVLYSNRSSFSGDTEYADKGVDIKLRLLEEERFLPEISVGLRDLSGTGLFDGEFIAATKRLATKNYGQFDFTVGLGWGYLGQRGNVTNPLCDVRVSFCDRADDYKDSGGTFDYNRWFHGSSALFAGIEYQTPYSPLVLKLEYDGNDYSQDFPVTRANVDMTPKTPWNLGAVYKLTDHTSIRLSFERGDTVSLGFTLNTNLDSLRPMWVNDEPIPEQSEQASSSVNLVDWQNIDAELSQVAGYEESRIYMPDESTVTLAARQSKYRDRNEAHERAAAIFSNSLPDTIDTYNIIEVDNNLVLKETSISAASYRDVANVSYIGASIEDAVNDVPVNNQIMEAEPLYSGFDPLSYGIGPLLSQGFGNAEGLYLYNLGIVADASYWFNRHLLLSSSLSFHIVGNYDKFNYIVPSDNTSNPRVRTLFRAYVHDNDTYMDNLQLTWLQKYGSNWYQQFYGGYLETMFAGVGSEVLYRRPNSSWAVGADLNLITQRDPSSLFSVFNDPHGYSQEAEVLDKGITGHLSLYYEPRFTLLENTLFRLDIGKFLAGDMGLRLDVSKQYHSGVTVGAYASITNLSAEEYGEGSFTKGFYLSIPFDLMATKPSTSRVNIGWQPITRDGGQKLDKRYSLFSMTDPVSPWYERPVRE